MANQSWKQKAEGLGFTHHEWYDLLEATLEQYPELVKALQQRDELEDYINVKVSYALAARKAALQDGESPENAHQLAMEELLSMPMAEDAKDNPDLSDAAIEAAERDNYEGATKFLDFLYGDG
jgi:hypothetical protein